MQGLLSGSKLSPSDESHFPQPSTPCQLIKTIPLAGHTKKYILNRPSDIWVSLPFIYLHTAPTHPSQAPRADMEMPTITVPTSPTVDRVAFRLSDCVRRDSVSAPSRISHQPELLVRHMTGLKHVLEDFGIESPESVGHHVLNEVGVEYEPHLCDAK